MCFTAELLIQSIVMIRKIEYLQFCHLEIQFPTSFSGKFPEKYCGSTSSKGRLAILGREKYIDYLPSIAHKIFPSASSLQDVTGLLNLNVLTCHVISTRFVSVLISDITYPFQEGR